MARGTSAGPTLAENVAVTSGLHGFRNVASAPRQLRDSPFGRPPVPVAAEAAPASEAPKPQPVQHGAPPPRKTPREPRIARKYDEMEGDDAELSPEEDKVTVPLSRALRDHSEQLARVISRSRTVRKHRITRNSVIRVALQCFLDEFSLLAGRPVNSEDELLEAARSRRKR